VIQTIHDRSEKLLRKGKNPRIKCVSCGNAIYLDPVTYWNCENIPIRCYVCKTALIITLEGGELKSIKKE